MPNKAPTWEDTTDAPSWDSTSDQPRKLPFDFQAPPAMPLSEMQFHQPGTDVAVHADQEGLLEKARNWLIPAPEDIPSGGNTTMPGLTIPLSAGLKTLAGFGRSITSPQGVVEMGASMTPLAPVIYAKWAHDLAKYGAETAGELSVDVQKPNKTPEDWQKIAEESADLGGSGLAGLGLAHSGAKPLLRIGEDVALTKGDAQRIASRELVRNLKGEPTFESTSPMPQRRLGIPTPSQLSPDVLAPPNLRDLANRSLAESQQQIKIPGEEPSLLQLRREFQPQIEPQPSMLKEEPLGGQISFNAPAEAEALPSARQTANPEVSNAPNIRPQQESGLPEHQGTPLGQDVRPNSEEVRKSQSTEAVSGNRPDEGGNVVPQQAQEVAVPEPTESQLGKWKESSGRVSWTPDYFKGAGDNVFSPDWWVQAFDKIGSSSKFDGTGTSYQIGKFIRSLGKEEGNKVIDALEQARQKMSDELDAVKGNPAASQEQMARAFRFGTGVIQLPREAWEAAMDTGSAKGEMSKVSEPPIERISKSPEQAQSPESTVATTKKELAPAPELTVEGVTPLEPASGTALSATDALINKLEALKLRPSGGATFSLPHPEAVTSIGKSVWNTAVDAAITAIKAGRKIGDAIEEAISYVKKNARGFDEAKLRANIGYVLGNEVPGKTVPGTTRSVEPAVSGAGPAATTPEKIGLGFTKFAKQDVLPAISAAIEGVKQAGADVQSALTPPNVSNISQAMAGNMRENLADLARKTEIAHKEFRKASKAFSKVDNQTNLEFIRRMEAGEVQPTPELQSISQKLRSAFDKRVEQVRALGTGKLEQVIEDYFPHIWTQESVDALHGVTPQAGNIWQRIFGKRPLEGPKSFLKQRSFPTTDEGIRAGLVPVTYNPVDLALLKMREIDRYIAGQKIFQEMKGNGTAQIVAYDDRPPIGWSQINDKIARAGSAGRYFAPDDAARVINNYLSPGLAGNVIFDAVRGMGNILNQAQLGISGYHATFTAIDSATSALALGLKQIAESKGSPSEIASGLLSAGKGAIPLYAPLENFIKASPFLKEYYKPGSVGGQIAGIVDAFQAAGGRVKMDSFYKNSTLENFWKAFREGNYPGAVLRAPMAALQLISKPLMEIMVPRMKIGIFTDMAKYELSKMTDEQKLDRNYVRKTLGAAWDSVDNRMGQMVYDNLFWNKTLKDLSMASVRSVGWNLGTLRELGGGVSDATIGAAKAILQGRDIGGGETTRMPQFSLRMGYVVALPIIVGLYGALYQYLKTGKGPQDLKDYFIPRTGQKNPDGTDERVMLPTYMKDVSPLVVATSHSGIGGGVKRAVEMAQNKSNPIISAISQMLRNKDFYGTQIRNPDDPLTQQVADELKFMGLQFEPFSIRNTKQRVGEGVAPSLEGKFGIMPAAKELTRTKAQQMMSEIIRGKNEEAGTTKEVAARRQALKDIVQTSTKPEAHQKILDMMKAGQLTEEQAKTAIRNQSIPSDIRAFKTLSVPEALKVYSASTPQEKAAFKSYLKEKIYNATRTGNWPKGKPIPKLDDENVKKVGETLVKNGKTYRVTAFDADGEPMVEEVK